MENNSSQKGNSELLRAKRVDIFQLHGRATIAFKAAMYDEIMAESFCGQPGAGVDPGVKRLLTPSFYQAKIKCWRCRKTDTQDFYRVYTPDERHWMAVCECGTKNYICRPDWDQAEVQESRLPEPSPSPHDAKEWDLLIDKSWSALLEAERKILNHLSPHFEPVKLGIALEKLGRDLSQPLPSGPNTQEVIDAYLTHMEDEGVAEGYLKVRARKLRFFARQYPELPTSPETIRVYLRQFKTRDVSTRQDQWKALSALYKFASNTYGLPNPMPEVEKPRFKKKPGQRLSRDQARLLLTAVKTDLEWALVTCYFGLRFRRVEAERLQLGEVKTDYLIVRGKERTEELPLLPVFRDKLLRFDRGQSPGDPLFPIKGDTMAYHIKQIFRRAGIVGVRLSPHTLRNTAGRLWLTYGGDDRANRQLLRHSNRTMTDHYSELNIDELYAFEERFNPMLNLMRELSPTLTNTTGVRETEAAISTYQATTDPAQMLPELLDQMIAVGETARQVSQALGGNGHRPEQLKEIIEYLEHQARNRLGAFH